MNAIPHTATHEEMLRRICGEYLEMPGLRLKREQAQRLWGLDEATCAQLLDVLVEAGFLRRLAGGTYGRLTDGAIARPAFHMAKAELDPKLPVRAGKSAA
jgi:hypothetical protein